jgi:hypothetical protein
MSASKEKIFCLASSTYLRAMSLTSVVKFLTLSHFRFSLFHVFLALVLFFPVNLLRKKSIISY